MDYSILDIVAEGDLVALHIDAYDYLGKDMKIMAFFHFKEGKIHRVHTLSNIIAND